jgi:hypothetical protein
VDGEHFGSQTTIAWSAANRQPRADPSAKLPPAFWRVTELYPSTSFTWVSRAPAVLVTAQHSVEEIADGTRVTLSIRYEGLLGALLARWVGDLNRHYLVLEADGLKARCTGFAAKPSSRC